MKSRGRKNCFIYFTASISRTIYVGFTDCLVKRMNQHKKGFYDNAFSKKYKTNRLVYWERYNTKQEALDREKQIKKWSRKKKIDLIEEYNSEWKDLYEDIIELSKINYL